MKRREIVTCILLSIFTCGIYGIVWFVGLVNDVNEATKDKDAKSGGIVFLLTLLTCGIYAIIWYYKAGEKLDAARTAIGLPGKDSAVIYLILNLIGLEIVAAALVQSSLNEIIDKLGATKAE